MRPNKSLGQHFLTSPLILKQIADHIPKRLSDEESLCEIGPGKGALTEYLVEHNPDLTAIEIDTRFAQLLSKKFPQLHLHIGDILAMDLSFFSQGYWHICGNLPYNIGTKIITLLLPFRDSIRSLHFTLQKEVACRLAANPGDEHWGRLSILVQLHWQVCYLFDISSESFFPPPKVESAFVALIPKEEAPADILNLKLFHALVKQGFAQRRKVLSTALKSLVPIEFWSTISISPRVRAETLSIDAWILLTNSLVRYQNE